MPKARPPTSRFEGQRAEEYGRKAGRAAEVRSKARACGVPRVADEDVTLVQFAASTQSGPLDVLQLLFIHSSLFTLSMRPSNPVR